MRSGPTRRRRSRSATSSIGRDSRSRTAWYRPMRSGPGRPPMRRPPGEQRGVAQRAGHAVGAHRVQPVAGVADQGPARAVRGAEIAGRQIRTHLRRPDPVGRREPVVQPDAPGTAGRTRPTRCRARTAGSSRAGRAADEHAGQAAVGRDRRRRSAPGGRTTRSRRSAGPPSSRRGTRRRARPLASTGPSPHLAAIVESRPSAPITRSARVDTESDGRADRCTHDPGDRGRRGPGAGRRPERRTRTTAPARSAASTSSASSTVRRGAYSASTPADGLIETATGSSP